MTHCSRKRPRSCEDEQCDLMPISKRINDLHIRSGFPEKDSTTSENETNVQTTSQSNKNPNVCMTNMSKESFEKDNFQCTYEPELSVAENPYYYHVNEVLFEAHVERLQRSSTVMS